MVWTVATFGTPGMYHMTNAVAESIMRLRFLHDRSIALAYTIEKRKEALGREYCVENSFANADFERKLECHTAVRFYIFVMAILFHSLKILLYIYEDEIREEILWKR